MVSAVALTLFENKFPNRKLILEDQKVKSIDIRKIKKTIKSKNTKKSSRRKTK